MNGYKMNFLYAKVFFNFVFRDIKAYASKSKLVDAYICTGITHDGHAATLSYIKKILSDAAKMPGYDRTYGFIPIHAKLIKSEIGGVAYVDGYLHSAGDKDDIVCSVQYSAIANLDGTFAITVMIS